ncbi:MAG: DegV family protein, partial [Solobacterium sp.]|nr:DegV family protein [Solobacterium sp.]
MKVAFVTDSGTGKSIHEYAEQGIISLPLQISVDDTTYQDMETEYKNNLIKEAIDNIEGASELLSLAKEIGDTLVNNYIIKP